MVVEQGKQFANIWEEVKYLQELNFKSYYLVQMPILTTDNVLLMNPNYRSQQLILAEIYLQLEQS